MLVAVPVTLVMAMAGAGVFGGTQIQNASGGALSADATPLAPAGPAFSIWSVIYLGLAAYGVWQVLPKHRARDRVRWLGLASMVLNAAWILLAQAGMLALTVVVIVALLAVLLAIFERLRKRAPEGIVEAIVVDGTFGLYLGWVCVATVANIAAWLASLGVRPVEFEVPTVVMLLVAAAIGVAIAWRGRGRFAPALSLAWGLAWIGVARGSGEHASQVVVIAAFVAAGIVLVAALFARIRAR